jgi:hypothetical protein
MVQGLNKRAFFRAVGFSLAEAFFFVEKQKSRNDIE